MSTKHTKSKTHIRPVKIQIYEDDGGAFRFRFRRNGEILGDNYTRRQDAHRGVRALVDAIRGGHYKFEDL